MGYENTVGVCKICKVPVYIDEGYRKLGETLLEGIICEDCINEHESIKCPNCETKYKTLDEAKDCFKACSGLTR